MQKKKILCILLVFILLLTTGCNNANGTIKKVENTEEKEEVQKIEEKEEEEEEKINVAGTYFIYSETGVPEYTEYITLKEDMSYDRQINYCAEILHIDGNYEVKKDNGKVLINLIAKDYDNSVIPIEFQDDKIIYDYEKYRNSASDNEALLHFSWSCSNFNSPMVFHKGDSSKIEYLETADVDIVEPE